MPKSLEEWAHILVLGGAAAVAVGIMNKAKFETGAQTKLSLDDYNVGSKFNFEFGADR